MDTSKLEEMLALGADNALLRFTLGSACHKSGKLEQAETHLAKAIEFNPDYSAAWKIYARVLSELDKISAAIAAFEQGIDVASKQGDIQAVREMNVFLKRLKKNTG